MMTCTRASVETAPSVIEQGHILSLHRWMHWHGGWAATMAGVVGGQFFGARVLSLKPAAFVGLLVAGRLTGLLYSFSF